MTRDLWGRQNVDERQKTKSREDERFNQVEIAELSPGDGLHRAGAPHRLPLEIHEFLQHFVAGRDGSEFA